MPHAALCVCRDKSPVGEVHRQGGFQCRTQHCVCRDVYDAPTENVDEFVSMPHAALCVSGPAAAFAMLLALAGFNAARSIVCVGTLFSFLMAFGALCFNAARSIVCVGTCIIYFAPQFYCGFNAARSIVCVETAPLNSLRKAGKTFQCRTQHCVCRDDHERGRQFSLLVVSMPHAALCVSRRR